MKNKSFQQFLQGLTTGFTPVVSADYQQEAYVKLDLSVDNEELQTVDTASAKAIGFYIDQFLVKSKGEVAYGGYNEKRSIYNRSDYFNKLQPDQQRNIHLGVDIWCPAGTMVLAALDGKVHSFKDNRNYGDYGPCIILEHDFNNTTFYTLYGHLSRRSLEGLAEGKVIKAGKAIARLGEPEENGDYAPHLHFQIIKDMQGNRGDYPGVSARPDLDFYLENCPDPELLLKTFK